MYCLLENSRDRRSVPLNPNIAAFEDTHKNVAKNILAVSGVKHQLESAPRLV